MRQSQNIESLLSVLYDLEMQDLTEALMVQKYDFTFRENRPEIILRDENTDKAFLLTVHRIQCDDESGWLLLNGERKDTDSQETNLTELHFKFDHYVPGEIETLAGLIPCVYLEPQTVEKAWEFFKGEHLSTGPLGGEVNVSIKSEKGTIVLTDGCGACVTINGWNADKALADLYEKIQSGSTSLKAALQHLVDMSDIYLPF